LPNEAESLFYQMMHKHSLIHAVFSNPWNSSISKIEIRPVVLKEKLMFQITQQVEKKALHSNLSMDECIQLFSHKLLIDYKQGNLFTTEGDFQLLTSKKGETKILRKPATKKLATQTHNKKKNYFLVEGELLPFLIELGLMNSQGKIFPQKMAKFRQINRFLEMVDDTLNQFKTNQTLNVIDFGCGKAYLTFALFYYLRFIKNFDVRMVGLDLKTDVIEFCSKLSEKLGYKGLNFTVGDIAAYIPKDSVNMVVALHACDTATDAALAQAVKWKSQVILAAPCCQHELYKQLKSEPLKGMLNFGILKERFAALATDAARALILETQGYTTQILEFIDPDETPKNLLIRAILGNTTEKREHAANEYRSLKHSLGISPSIEKFLN
jgi:SAM-dependent methyltransferase